MSHLKAIDDYVNGVLQGSIPACKHVKRACQRHVDDLKKLKNYYFDTEEVERVISLIEVFPHVSGPLAAKREKIKLAGWQKFIVGSIFGWRDKITHFRRFTEAYIQVPRKNGKSTLMATIGNVMTFADGEFGAEVLAGATTERQAYKVFPPARKMILNTPDLKSLGIEVYKQSIVVSHDQSVFRPIIGDPGDGDSPSCAIVDEFHEHNTSDLYDTMKTGMVARDEPLCLIITTAGVNLASPCHDKYEEVVKMLAKPEDDSLFGIIYTIDEDDDWTTIEAAQKANPNFGISIFPRHVETALKRAKNNPSQQVAYKTKHLNIWCAAKRAAIDLDKWYACGDDDLKIEDFLEDDCIGAIDLATREDIAGKVYLFRRVIDGLNHYYAFPKFYVPIDRAYERTDTDYIKWINSGELHYHDGVEISYSQMEADVVEDADQLDLHELVYDPWQATQMAQNLEDKGLTVVELRNGYQSFSEPFKELLAAISAKRFHHPNNAVFSWMASNVVELRDQKDNIRPAKEKPQNKIDGIVCTVMALNRMMALDDGYIKGFVNI